MSSVYPWALDFVRALAKRPLIIKILLRLMMGKYAYREFIGMIDALNKDVQVFGIGYSLENCEYQKDKVRKNWWEDKE